MTAAPATIISADDRLKAYALYTMAAHHNAECNRFYEALCRTLIGSRDADTGDISDSIWGFDAPASEVAFNAMLKRMAISVEEPK